MSGAPLYRSRRKGISLTPLIDVVFILLMFFMLTLRSRDGRRSTSDFPLPAPALPRRPPKP